MNCNGDEDTLLNCNYTRLSLSQSSDARALDIRSFPTVAVTCQGNSSQLSDECSSGEVRLANSSNDNMEGRVEMAYGSVFVISPGASMKHTFFANSSLGTQSQVFSAQ